MKKQITKLIACGLLALSSSVTFADWDPEWVEGDFALLETTAYQNIKKQVLKACKGSWCSEEKAALLMDLITMVKPQNCVEVGAFMGSTTRPIATALKFIDQGHLYAIDAWSNQIATRYWSDSDPNKSWWSTVDMKTVKNQFENMLKTEKLQKYCTVVHSPAELVIFNSPVKEDESPILSPDQLDLRYVDGIDFLLLDGDYSEQGSMQDVKHFIPKVKSGGYILLSNLFTMVNGKQPKLKSFVELLNDCEIVCEIEHDNAILFKKY